MTERENQIITRERQASAWLLVITGVSLVAFIACGLTSEVVTSPEATEFVPVDISGDSVGSLSLGDVVRFPEGETWGGTDYTSGASCVLGGFVVGASNSELAGSSEIVRRVHLSSGTCVIDTSPKRTLPEGAKLVRRGEATPTPNATQLKANEMLSGATLTP